jgi:C4-dicarboxylate transporter, DctM subunit
LPKATFATCRVDFLYTGLLYSIPLALVSAASAFGWMLAYLRGPDIVSGWIELIAGHDGRIMMLLLVLLFAVPAIIIFMPIVIKLNELGDINSLHRGVVLITTLVFGLITPPYGPVVAGRLETRRRGFHQSHVGFAADLCRVSRHHRLHGAMPKCGALSAEAVLPESVGCFKNPSGTGDICPR